jgi:hypothetical protein
MLPRNVVSVKQHFAAGCVIVVINLCFVTLTSGDSLVRLSSAHAYEPWRCFNRTLVVSALAHYVREGRSSASGPRYMIIVAGPTERR